MCWQPCECTRRLFLCNTLLQSQLALDGPNVNKSVLKKTRDKRSPEPVQFIPTGTCGIHTLHNSFKTGFSKAKFNISQFLKDCCNLFDESRGKFLASIGEDCVLPKKYCLIRWLGNGKAAETVLKIYDQLKTFVHNPKKKRFEGWKTVEISSRLFQRQVDPSKTQFFRFAFFRLRAFFTRLPRPWTKVSSYHSCTQQYSQY